MNYNDLIKLILVSVVLLMLFFIASVSIIFE